MHIVIIMERFLIVALLILKLVPSLTLAQGLISGLKAHYEFNGNLIG